MVVLAIGLLACVVPLLRSGDAHPWAAIGLAALTSALAFTVGGESDSPTGGPSAPIVLGGLVGLLSVVAGILALIPRSRKRPPSRVPIMISVVAIVGGAVGIALTQLV